MNIYIYGNDQFKGKIDTILDHANIKIKIDGKIKNIADINKLKELIKDDPTNIFLIDQDKLIVENFSNKIFKFLVPKDGIKKSFLDKYGIGDISLRTYEDLGVYINKRLEAIENAKPKPHEITSIDDILEDDALEALSNIA